jgi:hypothetical protein
MNKTNKEYHSEKKERWHGKREDGTEKWRMADCHLRKTKNW